jgi:hypothetical protein
VCHMLEKTPQTLILLVYWEANRNSRGDTPSCRATTIGGRFQRPMLYNYTACLTGWL